MHFPNKINLMSKFIINKLDNIQLLQWNCFTTLYNSRLADQMADGPGNVYIYYFDQPSR